MEYSIDNGKGRTSRRRNNTNDSVDIRDHKGCLSRLPGYSPSGDDNTDGSGNEPPMALAKTAPTGWSHIEGHIHFDRRRRGWPGAVLVCQCHENRPPLPASRNQFAKCTRLDPVLWASVDDHVNGSYEGAYGRRPTLWLRTGDDQDPFDR